MNKIYRKQFFRHRGVSCVGLAMMMLCLSLAGVFWLKASSLDGRVRTAPVVDVHPQTKNIEDVKAGDRVWAYDPVHDKWEAKPVIKPLVHDYAGDMITVSVAGQTIKCTGNHPFWVAGGASLFDREQARDVYPSDRTSAIVSGKGRWIEARKLQAGDLLVLRNGSQIPIEQVQVSYARQKVYNLQVADLHTYAVSDVGVAVHNKPCFPPGTLILMGDGSVKPIEQVELGDQVMAGDPLATGPPHPAMVTGLIRDFAAHLVDVQFKTASGTTTSITSTKYHPFWTNNRGWVDAVGLQAGDVLQDSGRNAIVVTNVKTRPHFGRSYNFEVASVHSYYALANDRTPILVHNQALPPYSVSGGNVSAPGGAYTLGSPQTNLPYQPVPPGNEIYPYYPPNRGFYGETNPNNSFNGGDIFQRFGGTTGTFVTEPGTSPFALSLPPGSSTVPNLYQVQPGYTIPYRSGTAGAAFGQGGGGFQGELGWEKTIQDLLDEGAIQAISR